MPLRREVINGDVVNEDMLRTREAQVLNFIRIEISESIIKILLQFYVYLP